MSAPVNTARVINHVRKRESTVSNDDLIKLAGGTDAQWGFYMKGQRAQCIVRAVNQELKDDGLALSSEGIGSEQWQLVSCAEKNRREAWFNLNRVDAHFKNAMESVEAIVTDHRAPKRIRENAEAWLELFKEPRAQMELSILKEFALELAGEMSKESVKALPKPQSQSVAAPVHTGI